MFQLKKKEINGWKNFNCYSYENTAILKLFEHKKKEIEIGDIRIPYKSLELGKISDSFYDIGKNGKIHLILELDEFGKKPFPTLNPLNDNLIACKVMTLNIKIIEANDIPSMDLNGFSDPYIKLYMLGKKEKEKIGEVKTKIIKKTLNPFWNEEYHFPIKSLRTDVLHMSLKDYDTIGRDDAISNYNLSIDSLPLGIVMDEWLDFIPVKGVKKGGKVHVKYHLASPGSFAFKDKPFSTKILNIRIIEAKDVKAMDFNGFSDPYCILSIFGDRTFLTTNIKYETLSPYWNETFQLLITNYETDVFKLELKDKDKFKDDEIGSANLELNKFEVGKIYKKWMKLDKKEKRQGQSKLKLM